MILCAHTISRLLICLFPSMFVVRNILLPLYMHTSWKVAWSNAHILSFCCLLGRGLLDTLYHHAGSGWAAFVLPGMLAWAVCQLGTHFCLEDSTPFTR